MAPFDRAQAAQEVFAEDGLDASFDEIARRAGVGVGTVYRRFPDREDLVEALFTQRIGEVIACARRAALVPEPWDALVGFLRETVAMQAADRGLKQVLAASDRGRESMAGVRDDLEPLVGELLHRARACGALRTDVTVLDVAALSSALSAVSTAREPELWRRYLPVVLDGLRVARTTTTPLPLGPPQEEDLAELAHPGHPPR